MSGEVILKGRCAALGGMDYMPDGPMYHVNNYKLYADHLVLDSSHGEITLDRYALDEIMAAYGQRIAVARLRVLETRCKQQQLTLDARQKRLDRMALHADDLEYRLGAQARVIREGRERKAVQMEAEFQEREDGESGRVQLRQLMVICTDGIRNMPHGERTRIEAMVGQVMVKYGLKEEANVSG